MVFQKLMDHFLILIPSCSDGRSNIISTLNPIVSKRYEVNVDMTVHKKLGLEQLQQLLYSLNFVPFKGDNNNKKKKPETYIAIY